MQEGKRQTKLISETFKINEILSIDKKFDINNNILSKPVCCFEFYRIYNKIAIIIKNMSKKYSNPLTSKVTQ